MLNVLVGSQGCNGCPFLDMDTCVARSNREINTPKDERPDWCPLPVLVSTGTSELNDVLNELAAQLKKNAEKFPPFHNAHDGYAHLLEEVDELKAHVWTNEKHRNLRDMRKEAIDVASVALQIAMHICNEERGRR